MSQIIETHLGRQFRQQVRQQVIANERRLLRRLADSRFGAKTAEQFTGLVEHINDPMRLEDIGEMIVHSRTGADLLHRVRESAQ